MTHLGPQILLCTAGEVRLSSGETELLLTKGCSAWSPAGEPSVTVVAGSDGAQVFRVRAGLDEE
jgi:mannose-6-phosphate isomerase class I